MNGFGDQRWRKPVQQSLDRFMLDAGPVQHRLRAFGKVGEISLVPAMPKQENAFLRAAIDHHQDGIKSCDALEFLRRCHAGDRPPFLFVIWLHQFMRDFPNPDSTLAAGYGVPCARSVFLYSGLTQTARFLVLHGRNRTRCSMPPCLVYARDDSAETWSADRRAAKAACHMMGGPAVEGPARQHGRAAWLGGRRKRVPVSVQHAKRLPLMAGTM